MCVELNLWALSSSGGPISNPDSNLGVGTRTVARSDPVRQSRINRNLFEFIGFQPALKGYAVSLGVLDLLGIPWLGRKNIKTFRWDQRLQIQNLFMAFKRVPRWK